MRNETVKSKRKRRERKVLATTWPTSWLNIVASSSGSVAIFIIPVNTQIFPPLQRVRETRYNDLKA